MPRRLVAPAAATRCTSQASATTISDETVALVADGDELRDDRGRHDDEGAAGACQGVDAVAHRCEHVAQVIRTIGV